MFFFFQAKAANRISRGGLEFGGGLSGSFFGGIWPPPGETGGGEGGGDLVTWGAPGEEKKEGVSTAKSYQPILQQPGSPQGGWRI